MGFGQRCRDDVQRSNLKHIFQGQGHYYVNPCTIPDMVNMLLKHAKMAKLLLVLTISNTQDKNVVRNDTAFHF